MPTLVTQRSYENACENYRGFCIKCKKFTRDCTEPDAEGYDCPKCKGKTVIGAENALVMGIVDIK